MKRLIILTSAYLSISFCSFGQKDSTNFEKLLYEFSQQYAYTGKSSSANFVIQLSDATNFILNIANPVFLHTKSDFTILYTTNNEDSILSRITDSIYKRFINDFFWQDQQTDLLKFRTVLAMYAEKLCACLSPVLASDYKYRDLVSIVTECDNATTTDVIFMSRLTAELKKIPLSDRQKLQQYAAKYSYQHCPAYYQALNQPLFNSVIDNHYAFLRDISRDMEERIVTLYTQNKIDSLRLIFPDYSLYKKDIEKSSASIKAQVAYTVSDFEKDKEGKGLINRTMTFYRSGKKSTLLGQIACSYRIDNLVLKVQSFQFIPADKIKNKAGILNDIDIEPPPPPLQEIIVTPVPKKGN